MSGKKIRQKYLLMGQESVHLYLGVNSRITMLMRKSAKYLNGYL
ncbi:hypothetical protein Q666_00025 [Marinobacter sp. ES-1]|nr:hypothetical protein Q666_00025 [Marinobacter sp. ES-1]